jgi:RNA recognition motif-containing protein
MEQEKVYSDTSLFVGDLAQLSTEVELAECFSQYGELAEVRIMRNNTTRKPLCYGFVTFAVPENAKAALEGLNGQPFQGRNLR